MEYKLPDCTLKQVYRKDCPTMYHRKIIIVGVQGNLNFNYVLL